METKSNIKDVITNLRDNSGYSWGEICRELNKKGIKTPKGYDWNPARAASIYFYDKKTPAVVSSRDDEILHIVNAVLSSHSSSHKKVSLLKAILDF